MAAYNKINQFVQDLANKKHDLSADTYKWDISGSAGAGETFDLSVWRVPGE